MSIPDMVAHRDNKPEIILRLREVERRCGIKHSSIFKAIAAGTFPAPFKIIGGRANGWAESVIQDWIAERIAVGKMQPPPPSQALVDRAELMRRAKRQKYIDKCEAAGKPARRKASDDLFDAQ